MIQVENLTKRFGALTAVDQLSFEVDAGESVALWGGNGAGKTTALRCILGVVPYDGAVRVGGYHTIHQGKDARRLIGFVPQEISLHDDMTVMETIRFYARLKKTDTTNRDAVQLWKKLGLASYSGKRVRDLSGGMKQRLALIIALLANPPILLLDETTANLDVKAREEFLALLNELKEGGRTLVFSSHRPEEISALADRVLVLEEGKLIGDCAPSALSDLTGSRAMLKLHLADETWIGPAVSTLKGNGFSAERNGTGVWVQVLPLEKAKPISVLTEAGIPVDDFQYESGGE
jgi:ABC-type multidrug transport system ATPase subunit